MFHIALYQPEIPPNTGNIIRLAANTGCTLHLIHPMGFAIEDKHVKRAGLDYHEMARVHEYENFAIFYEQFKLHRIFALSTKGKVHHTDVSFAAEDVFLFGPETRGLPTDIIETLDKQNLIRIPMVANSRSLNLSNAVAVVVYEAWRQCRFEGIDSV